MVEVIGLGLILRDSAGYFRRVCGPDVMGYLMQRAIPITNTMTALKS